MATGNNPGGNPAPQGRGRQTPHAADELKKAQDEAAKLKKQLKRLQKKQKAKPKSRRGQEEPGGERKVDTMPRRDKAKTETEKPAAVSQGMKELLQMARFALAALILFAIGAFAYAVWPESWKSGKQQVVQQPPPAQTYAPAPAYQPQPVYRPRRTARNQSSGRRRVQCPHDAQRMCRRGGRVQYCWKRPGMRYPQVHCQ